MPNYVQENGAINGSAPSIGAGADTDANVGFNLTTVGTGAVGVTTQNTDYPVIAGGTGVVNETIGGASANVNRKIFAKGTGTTEIDSALILHAVNALVYGATVTPDASLGLLQQLTLTSGETGAIAMAAPANPPAASRTEEMTIEIVNTSGGAMGAITWNAAYKLTNGAFTNPASTMKRFIKFFWNGANWIEIVRAAVDY